MAINMTKEVQIVIQGLQFDEADGTDKVETLIDGTYFYKNQYHYVVFEEKLEGFSEPTKSTIKFNEKEMTLVKHGLTNTHMLFEINKKNRTSYGTPYGNIMLTIEADRIAVTESDTEIQLQVGYRLEVNDAYLSDCVIQLNIKQK